MDLIGQGEIEMKKTLWIVFSLLIVWNIFLTACQPLVPIAAFVEEIADVEEEIVPEVEMAFVEEVTHPMDGPDVEDFHLQVPFKRDTFLEIKRVSEESYQVMFINHDGILPPIKDVSFAEGRVPLEEINSIFDADGKESYYFPARVGEFFIFLGQTHRLIPEELEVGQSYRSLLKRSDFPVLRIFAGGYAKDEAFQKVYYVTAGNNDSYTLLVNGDIVSPNDKVFQTSSFSILEFLVSEVESISVWLEDDCFYEFVRIPKLVEDEVFDLTYQERMEIIEVYVYSSDLTCSFEIP